LFILSPGVLQKIVRYFNLVRLSVRLSHLHSVSKRLKLSPSYSIIV